MLAQSLENATQHMMRPESIAREKVMFGDDFVDHYGGSRQHEVKLWNEAVTNWEGTSVEQSFASCAHAEQYQWRDISSWLRRTIVNNWATVVIALPTDACWNSKYVVSNLYCNRPYHKHLQQSSQSHLSAGVISIGDLAQEDRDA